MNMNINMDTRTRAILICWLIMITILSFDLVTTIVGVEMLGAVEQNTFAKMLFDMGLFGYPLVLVCYAIFFLCNLIILGAIYRRLYYKIMYKEISISKEIVIYCIVASTYLLTDGITIAKNLMVIWGLL